MTEQPFSVNIHLLRDDFLEAGRKEIERLQAKKLADADAADEEIARVAAMMETMRAWSDPYMHLPMLPQPIDDTESIIARFPPLAERKGRKLPALPPTETRTDTSVEATR